MAATRERRRRGVVIASSLLLTDGGESWKSPQDDERLEMAATKGSGLMADPAQLAAKLLADHAPGKFPVPVEDIAKALKVEVLRKRHEGPESSFAMRNEGSLIVGINNNTSSRRQRVATAHALGHVLMHDRPIIVCNAVRLPRPGIASRGSNEDEMQANAFAAALLMPPEVVTAVFAARDGQSDALFPRDEVVAELAKQFGVGVEFMCYRLVSLGLLAS